MAWIVEASGRDLKIFFLFLSRFTSIYNPLGNDKPAGVVVYV